jgi:cation:H+ antiporter
VPTVALTFDLPVMLAVAVACLPIFMAGYRINRWEGLLFLGYYVLYLLFLVLTAIDHDSRYLLGHAVLWFALPLTALTFGISLWRHRHPFRH